MEAQAHGDHSHVTFGKALLTTSGRVCLVRAFEQRAVLGLETLALKECSVEVLKSILLARYRIPLALNDKLLHQARIQNFASKAFLLQHL